MKVLNDVTKVSVPAGKYWLTDPCYLVPEELWMPLLNSCSFFEDPIGTVTDEDGKQHHVLAFGTAYGDGEYLDQFGHSFPVDAGLIGLVPVSLAGENNPGYLLVEFTEETICTCNGGDMRFGKYRIDTRDGDDSDLDEEEQD